MYILLSCLCTLILNLCIFNFMYVPSPLSRFIVLFCVLFVCKYVLYYCHGVSNQSQLTKYIMSCHIHKLISQTWTSNFSSKCLKNDKNSPMSKPYRPWLKCNRLQSKCHIYSAVTSKCKISTIHPKWYILKIHISASTRPFWCQFHTYLT